MKTLSLLLIPFIFSVSFALDAGTEIPHFLADAPSAVIQEHANLLKNNADDDLAPVMDQWVNKQNVYIRRIRWAKYKAQETEGQQVANKFRRELREKLSDRAKEVDKALYDIGQNQKISRAEKTEKMRDKMATEDPEIRAEIEEAIQAFKQMRQPEHDRFKREWGMHAVSDSEMGMYMQCCGCCGCCGCCCCGKK